METHPSCDERTVEEVQMFKSILWATDGSEHAARALPYVKDLAQAGDGTSITIAHVVETGHGAGAVFLPRRAEEDQIVKDLTRTTDELRANGFSVSLEINDEVGTRPAYEVAEIARRANADLIVAGSRGLSTLGGLLLGSVTHRLLHIAPCPVLVVGLSGVELPV
jgi:nucleotide-binding universal stress UspA family protein